MNDEFDPAPASLWRNHDYMLLWSGQTVSSVGSAASELAFPLLVLALTGSPAQAGIVAALAALPYLFLSLPVGALVDRWDRKLVMIRADGIRAVNMASVPLAFWFGHLSLAQLYIVALIEGSGFVFFNIAEVAALPRVVPKRQLPDATAQNQIMYMVATLVGPPVGGFLYQTVGRVVPFLTDAISYACSVFGLLFIRTRFQEERVERTSSLRSEIAEGIAWVWRHAVVRDTAILLGLTTLLTSGGYLLLIVLAKHLGASPGGTGLILSIASVGGVAGALLAPRIQRRFSFGQVFIGLLWIQAILIVPFLLAGNLIVLTAATSMLFFTSPINSVVVMSYRLALIPDELQGRVNSVYRLALFAPGPAGTALMGISLQAFGTTFSLIVMAIGLGLVALGASFDRVIRQAPPIERLRDCGLTVVSIIPEEASA